MFLLRAAVVEALAGNHGGCRDRVREGLLLLTMSALSACAATDPAPEALASCFALPGVGSSATQLYELDSEGVPRRTSVARAPGYHVRATGHPDGHVLYVTGVGAPDNDLEGIAVYAFSLEGCAVGRRLASAGAGGEYPSNERAYGLVAHPSGRWLYQTTASLGSIRRFALDPRTGVPSLEAEHRPRADGLECVQIRRLAMSEDGRTLYSNCNNGSSDHAMHVWRVGEGGGLTEIQALSLDSMNGGVFDPVLHPSGDYLYQLTSSSRPLRPDGSGAYVVTFAVGGDGRLELVGRTAIRTREPGDSPTGLVYAVTLSFLPGGVRAYVAVHAALASMSTIHEVVELDIRGGGSILEVDHRHAPVMDLEFSSHHGAALFDAGDGPVLVSYLTDYDPDRGGILQVFRVDSLGHVVPGPTPWVATELPDGRQPIPIQVPAER